jgi:hypothetical protein
MFHVPASGLQQLLFGVSGCYTVIEGHARIGSLLLCQKPVWYQSFHQNYCICKAKCDGVIAAQVQE